MAVGRQDYQAGVVPIKSGYSLVQSNFFDHDSLDVAPGATTDFCKYTPSTGYRLNICGFRIAAARAFTHIMYMRVAGFLVFYRYFDTEIMDNFPEGVTMTVEAGEEVKLQVKNNDSLLAWIDVSIYGYLEQLIT